MLRRGADCHGHVTNSICGKIVIRSKASTGESGEEHTVSPDEKSQCHKGRKIKMSIQEGEKKNPHFETTSIPNAPFFAFLVSILSVAAVL